MQLETLQKDMPDAPRRRRLPYAVKIGVLGGSALGLTAINYYLYLKDTREELDGIVEEDFNPYNFFSCGKQSLVYQIPEGANLSSIVHNSGLVPPFIRSREAASLIQAYNNSISYTHEPGYRDPDLLFPVFSETRFPFTGDILVLPTTDTTIQFIKDEEQFPYPGAPEDILAELASVDPESFAGLEARAQAVFNLQNNEQARGDKCIFDIYNMEREFDLANIKQVLAEYTLIYGQDEYIQYLLHTELPLAIDRVNKILNASGVEKRLPENLADYAIFKLMVNYVGGGSTNDGLKPYFILVGNYAYINTLMFPQDYRYNLVHDGIHEGLHTIQPSYSVFNLFRYRETFSHSAMEGFVVAPFAITNENIGQFSTDARVQYVFGRLVNSGMDPTEAYKMIVKAAMDFEELEEIEIRYNETIYELRRHSHTHHYETFSELFAQDLFQMEYAPNSAFKAYASGNYLQDRDLIIAVQNKLTGEEVKQSSNPTELNVENAQFIAIKPSFEGMELSYTSGDNVIYQNNSIDPWLMGPLIIARGIQKFWPKRRSKSIRPKAKS